MNKKRERPPIAKSPVMKWLSAILCGTLSLIGCDAQKPNPMLTEEKLQTEIKVGSIAKLSDLIRDKADSVCVLHPYQEKIADKYHENVAVNKYLQDIKYQANESHWSLAILDADSTNVYTFRRSKVLDIFSSHGLKNLTTVSLPANFEMAECTSFDRAAFFKASINDRIYLIFGRIK